MADSLKEKLKEPMDTMPMLAFVQSWAHEVEKKNNLLSLALARIEHLEGDQQMLEDLLLRLGDHTNECAYIEEANTGRILKEEEDELCDCGWAETRKMLVKRLEERQSELHNG